MRAYASRMRVQTRIFCCLRCRANNGKSESGAIASSLSGKVSTIQNFRSRKSIAKKVFDSRHSETKSGYARNLALAKLLLQELLYFL